MKKIENKVLIADDNGHHLLRLIGNIKVNQCLTLNEYLTNFLSKNTNIQSFTVDLTKTVWLDSTMLGLLTRIAQMVKKAGRFKPILITENRELIDLIKSMYMDTVFTLSSNIPASIEKLVIDCSHHQTLSDANKDDCEQLKQEVIKSHKALMSLSSANTEKFIDLIKHLEA